MLQRASLPAVSKAHGASVNKDSPPFRSNMSRYSNSTVSDSGSSSLSSYFYSDETDSCCETSTVSTEHSYGATLQRFSQRPVIIYHENFDYIEALPTGHEETKRKGECRPPLEAGEKELGKVAWLNGSQASFERPSPHEKPIPQVEEYRLSFPESQHKPERTRDSEDPRSSWSTYSSSLSSEEEPEEQISACGPPDRYVLYPSFAVPSDPPEFAEHFPSTRRLHIRHDDTTLDGNMNLRVDTIKKGSFSRQDLTLFHLRMMDLQTRQFSVRRHGRYSGREVCHSKLRAAQTGQSAFQRSFKNALATMGIRAEKDDPAGIPLKRSDSGYHSNAESCKSKGRSIFETSQATISLEFSNYARVDVRKAGVGRSKHYGFEFWGEKYSWKRRVRRSAQKTTVSFHLYRGSVSHPVAHIVPECLTPREAYEEEIAGGWIPPSSLYISDRSILGALTDVAEVVVATGLIALVDDCIQRSWQEKDLICKQS